MVKLRIDLHSHRNQAPILWKWDCCMWECQIEADKVQESILYRSKYHIRIQELNYDQNTFPRRESKKQNQNYQWSSLSHRDLK